MGLLEAAILLAGGYGLYLWNQGRSAGHLIFYPNNITDLGFDGATTVISADMLIQNTSNATFTINSFAGNVTSNDTLIGNASSFTPTTIPPNNQALFPLELRLNPIGLVDEIISAIQTHNIDKEIVIDGNVNANGYQLPVKITYKIGL